MADIGKPERIIEIDPIDLPDREPVPEPAPATPQKEPEKVPA